MRVILCLAAALLCGSAQACQLKSAIDCAEAERVVGDLERAYDRFTALGVDVPMFWKAYAIKRMVHVKEAVSDEALRIYGCRVGFRHNVIGKGCDAGEE